MNNSLITDYALLQDYVYEMEKFDVKRDEWNIICDDNITVYLKISDNKVTEYSFTWSLSLVWKAAANILAEEITEVSIQEVLSWDFEFMKALGFEVSSRRKRASVLALLAARNAIHAYLNDGIVDEFDDIVDCQ